MKASGVTFIWKNTKVQRKRRKQEVIKPGNRSTFMRLLDQRINSMVTKLKQTGDFTTSCELTQDKGFRVCLVVHRKGAMD